MTNKEKYRQLCLTETTINIFSQDWWLDAVVGDNNWDVALTEENGEIIGTWPYFLKKRLGFNIITIPSLTKYLGIWFKPLKHKSEYERLSFEKKISESLVSQLPKFDSFIQFFSPQFTNWLSLYWSGFKQTTRYTYVIDKQSGWELIYNNFKSSRKTQINKGSKELTVKFDLDPVSFYNQRLHDLSLQGRKISFSSDYFQKIYDACHLKKCVKIIYCENKKGEIVAATLLVTDQNFCYYLIPTFDKRYLSSGASSLLISECVKWAVNNNLSFDFEGSMDENIEFFYRQFGAKQVPYFEISKMNNRLLLFLKSI